MARTLVRLKLRLLRNGFRLSGKGALVGLLITLLVAAIVGGLGGLLLATLRGVADHEATDVTVSVFAGLLVVWTLGPLLVAATGEPLAPEKLALFPLRPTQLVPGLLGAALVGAGGLATVLLLIGGIVGMAPVSPAALITVLAAATQLALCVAAGRLVATAISGAAHTRRWRDIAVFIAPLLGLAINIATQVSTGPSATTRTRGASHVLRVGGRLVPSSLTAFATADARTGHALRALIELAAAVALVAAVLWLWSRVLDRVLTMTPESSTPKSDRLVTLFPRWLGFLPKSRVGAVAAKEVRVSWRDPRQRAALVSAFFPAAILLFRAAGSQSPTIVLFVIGVAAFGGSSATNLYGFDGSRHWFNVAAGDDARSDLLGKNLARLLLTVPVLVVAGVGLAARGGGWSLLPAAFCLALAAYAVSLGLATRTSVKLPFPVGERRSSLYGGGGAGEGGKGLRLFVDLLVKLVITGVVVGPFALGVYALRDHAFAAMAVALGGAAVATGAWALAFGSAVRYSSTRQAELLTALSRRLAA